MDANDWTRNERTARPTLDVTTTRPPGRRAAWTAEAGHWRVDGPTERDTLHRLNAALSLFLANYRAPVIVAYGGATAVVSLDVTDSPNLLAYRQHTVYPDGRTSLMIGTFTGWDQVTAEARYHLVHLATDWHDDASVHAGAAFIAGGERYGHGQYGPEELYRYAAWQRAARAAMDAKRDDWHQWASEHEREFVVPRPDAD